MTSASNPLAIDLFCGAGGASRGLAMAGFEVTGVDINKQPRYPYKFIRADVMTLDIDLSIYDLIWASPPCQRYSNGAKQWGTSEQHPDLIEPTRQILKTSGKPYIIENIESARQWLHNPIMLCGQYFNLGVFRHRLFETSFYILEPVHTKHTGKVGDGKYHTVTGNAGGSSKRDGRKGGSTADWRIAMGIDWMTGKELSESIPPAYSEFIGRAAMKELTYREAAA